MNFNQIDQIINQSVHQMTGFETMENPLDAANLISLGDYVINSALNRDAWYNVLSDVIGKTIIDDTPYTADIKDLIYNVSEFGCVVRTIHTEPPHAVQNPSWVPTEGQTVGTWTIRKTDTTQKLFQSLNTWQVDISIPDIQLKGSFRDAESMRAFVSSMMTAMETSMQMQLEAMASMCYSNFIAEKIIHYKTNGGLGVVNLLSDYNSAHPSAPVTGEQALESKDFLRWASKVINDTVERIAKMSTLFNNDGFHRFSTKDTIRINILSEFASSCQYYLESDTFHENLVKLPGFKRIVYWQGSGKDFKFTNTSKVFMITSSGSVIEQPGVVCLISAEDAIGVIHDNRRTPADHDNNTETTTYHAKSDMGYFNDLSQNGVVFIIADRIEPVMKKYVITGAAEGTHTYEMTATSASPAFPGAIREYRVSGDERITIITYDTNKFVCNAPADDVADLIANGATVYGQINEGHGNPSATGAYTAATKTIAVTSPANANPDNYKNSYGIYDKKNGRWYQVAAVNGTVGNVSIVLTDTTAPESNIASQQWYFSYDPILV